MAELYVNIKAELDENLIRYRIEKILDSNNMKFEDLYFKIFNDEGVLGIFDVDTDMLDDCLDAIWLDDLITYEIKY